MSEIASTLPGVRVAFIGCAGVPNRYGGFEAFVEHCGPALAARVDNVAVTCDAGLYTDHGVRFNGMERQFIRVPANGGASVMHDLVAFFRVFADATHIVVLGVSGGLWFPLFRGLCVLTDKRLLVNVDGVEWRRTKFGRAKRALLRLLDASAQFFAHTVIYDNAALLPFLLKRAQAKSMLIAYPGDHVLRTAQISRESGTALTICRIEPENNIDMLINGAMASSLHRYTVVGNWDRSVYGRELRARHRHEPRLRLLDPVYDPQALAELREATDVYIHGHSVGGTNPSLVEMLFYDCELLCFDVPFHRETAGDSARYFPDAAALAGLLDSREPVDMEQRHRQRLRYTRDVIAAQYIAALGRSTGTIADPVR